MRNNKITASYIKDILDFMNKYHLNSVEIDSNYMLSYFENEYYIGDNKGNYVKSTDKKEFIEKLKASSMYKAEIV